MRVSKEKEMERHNKRKREKMERDDNRETCKDQPERNI